MLRISLAALTLAAASPAFADAATYWGHIGSADIVVEFSAELGDATEADIGRYFYSKNGIDVPLHVLESTPQKLVLYEELPCSNAPCEAAFDASSVIDEIKGAVWTLTTEDGVNINGTWVAKPGAEPLKIELGLFGTRPFELYEGATPFDLVGLPSDILYGKAEFTQTNAPYDYLRATAVNPDAGPDITRNGVTFRYLTDKRTKFPFPQIADIGGSIDGVVPANQRLLSRRNALMVNAFECEAQNLYYGMGWMPGVSEMTGTYGYYPEENIEVTYVSPTLMTWVESGSTDCGGAYPNNHIDYTTIDMQTGKDLDKSTIFAGSVQEEYRWVPSPELLAYVKANMTLEEGIATDEGCGMDDLINSYLDITFKDGDIAVFTLQDVPHVVFACQGDLLEQPISELKQFLAPTAAKYFPALKVQ